MLLVQVDKHASGESAAVVEHVGKRVHSGYCVADDRGARLLHVEEAVEEEPIFVRVDLCINVTRRTAQGNK